MRDFNLQLLFMISSLKNVYAIQFSTFFKSYIWSDSSMCTKAINSKYLKYSLLYLNNTKPRFLITTFNLFLKSEYMNPSCW